MAHPGSGAGYGFGYPAAIAGLMLVPYSLASFAAGRVLRPLLRRMSLEALILGGSGVLIVAMVVLLLGRSHLTLLIVSMALAGFGVGMIFAIQPAQLNAGVPAEETGSANSFYQVLRYVGYSLGSALSTTLLVATTPAGGATPTEAGYSAAAWLGIGALIVGTVAASLLNVHVARQRLRRGAGDVVKVYAEEGQSGDDARLVQVRDGQHGHQRNHQQQ
ncbi:MULTISPECIES: MFS transporter [unclassified Streptomyces]|uniref:MFS transporter n=1 Tax=unclassified Streptomyces TaxID=2593676 RepID=UPI002E178876|nr:MULTISPECIES: MFS transporter [unclassified Streptomyces]